jgi:hypothetical protein
LFNDTLTPRCGPVGEGDPGRLVELSSKITPGVPNTLSPKLYLFLVALRTYGLPLPGLEAKGLPAPMPPPVNGLAAMGEPLRLLRKGELPANAARLLVLRGVDLVYLGGVM